MEVWEDKLKVINQAGELIKSNETNSIITPFSNLSVVPAGRFC